MPRVVFIESEDFRELFRNTRDIGSVIRASLDEKLIDCAEMGARLARARVMLIPHTGHSTPHRAAIPRPPLRGRLAAGITVQKVGGVEVQQSSRLVTGRSSNALPRRIDEGGTFSHPVFGHRKNKAHEAGFRYFMKSMDELERRMTDKVEEVFDAAFDHLK